jgi:tetratricopeptide (TPR) repeat protein
MDKYKYNPYNNSDQRDDLSKDSLNINNKDLGPSFGAKKVFETPKWDKKENKNPFTNFNGPKDPKDSMGQYIFVVVVLVIGLALYFFYGRGEKEFNIPEAIDETNLELQIGEEDSTVESIENDGIEDGGTTLENQAGVITSINTSINTTTDDTKARFNLAMADARSAFARGDYVGAVAHYNKALAIQKSDFAYAGIYTVRTAQGDWTGAMIALDQAISVSPTNTDYWVWKLQILDEKMGTSFAEQKKVYEEGLIKTNPKTRVNLVTNFARIVETNGDDAYAVSLWQKAIELYPQNKDTYQSEIDRLEQK